MGVLGYVRGVAGALDERFGRAPMTSLLFLVGGVVIVVVIVAVLIWVAMSRDRDPRE